MKVRPPSSPPEENKLRFVCMADTHSLTSHLKVVDPSTQLICISDIYKYKYKKTLTVSPPTSRWPFLSLF